MRRFRFARTLALRTEQGRLAVWVAAGFGLRLLGLAGIRALPAGRGLLIPRCAAVHTWGMRFALDVAFLDRAPSPGATVLRVEREVGPRRLLRLAGRPGRHTAVLEAPAGALKQLGLEPGIVVCVSPYGGPAAAGPPGAACEG
jgi:uncharacterized membrane protein (UPF0127 family)